MFIIPVHAAALAALTRRLQQTVPWNYTLRPEDTHNIKGKVQMVLNNNADCSSSERTQSFMPVRHLQRVRQGAALWNSRGGSGGR